MAAALLSLIFNDATGFATTQQWNSHQGISSNEFLSQLSIESSPSGTDLHSFPPGILASQSFKSDRNATPAAFEQQVSGTQPQAVKTAQYEWSAASTSPIGTGVAHPAANLHFEPSPATSLPDVAAQKNPNLGGWRRKLALDPSLPDFLVGYEAVSIQRSNDSIGPYSQGTDMDRFTRDVSGRFTVSRLLGAIDRVEFKFTGPLHWNRQSMSSGPIDSFLPLAIAPQFDNANFHQQSHQVRLASYELNRCNTGDEMSKLFYGFRFIDHEEQYQLDSEQGVSTSQFRLKTSNILAGWQIGLQLNRPLSQRMTIGIGSGGGLYGNFAFGSLNATSGISAIADSKDRKLRLTAMWESVALINYRISQNILVSGGYEAWYFPGLATAADQRLEHAAQVAAFSLRSGDDQLFRGWTVGLSAQF